MAATALLTSYTSLLLLKKGSEQRRKVKRRADEYKEWLHTAFLDQQVLRSKPPEADMLFQFETIPYSLSHTTMCLCVLNIALEYDRKPKKTFGSSAACVRIRVKRERMTVETSLFLLSKPACLLRHAGKKDKVNNR